MTRTVLPNVDKQREAASRGSGKVKVYKLSEEELAQYKVSDSGASQQDQRNGHHIVLQRSFA